MPNTPTSMERFYFALFQKIYPFFSSCAVLIRASGLAWWIQQPLFNQPPSVRVYLIFVYKPIIISTHGHLCLRTEYYRVSPLFLERVFGRHTYRGYTSRCKKKKISYSLCCEIFKHVYVAKPARNALTKRGIWAEMTDSVVKVYLGFELAKEMNKRLVTSRVV